MEGWRLSRISDHEGRLASTREWTNTVWCRVGNEAGRSVLWLFWLSVQRSTMVVARCEVESIYIFLDSISRYFF